MSLGRVMFSTYHFEGLYRRHLNNMLPVDIQPLVWNRCFHDVARSLYCETHLALERVTALRDKAGSLLMRTNNEES